MPHLFFFMVITNNAGIKVARSIFPDNEDIGSLSSLNNCKIK